MPTIDRRRALVVTGSAVASWTVWVALHTATGVGPTPPGAGAIGARFAGGPGWAPAEVAVPDGVERISGSTRVELANEAASRMALRAPIAVAVADDDAALPGAVWLSARLRVPLLVDPDAPLLERLGVETLVAVGGGEVPATDGVTLRRVAVDAAGEVPPLRTLADVRAAISADDPAGIELRAVRGLLAAAERAPASAAPAVGVVVPETDADAAAAIATAIATGHAVIGLSGEDARATDALDGDLPGKPGDAAWVLGSESALPPPVASQLVWQLDVVRRGLELPGGGQLLFPGRTLVALYGTPGTGALGVLGEQDVDESIERVRGLAEDYAAHADTSVVPAFEIIASVASSQPEEDGDYSRRVPMETLRPWVEAAGEAGVYVVLDLQPGRTDFLTQAKELEPLLRAPHVGLALDPEWRLGPGERHLVQIGSVGIDEVHEVADWLAALTRRHALPQKLFLLHQFQLQMIDRREELAVPADLAPVIQMDGQGPQAQKLETWDVLRRTDPPEGVLWGWKNFYDEDTPTRSPEDTMALEPAPVFVSYQ